MRRLLLALAAAPLLAGCSDLLFAELEIPEIRITMPQQEFQSGTPLAADLCDLVTAGCVARRVEYDVGAEIPVVNEPGVTFDLRITDMALTLVSGGGGDFGGVEEVKILLLDAADASQGTVLAHYVRPEGAKPTRIEVSGNSNVNLASYLTAGKLPVRVEVVYEALNPPPDFTADVEVGLSLVATVDWGAYL